MQPYAHARATSSKSGRSWEDDLPIHEFMDLAKHACPDLRHRLILHNADLGPELAALAFPHRPEARSVALMHVRQDLGCLPHLADWLARCEPSRLPPCRPQPDSFDEIVHKATLHYGLADPTPIEAVRKLLQLPSRFIESCAVAERLLLNSFGPILARTVLGPPRAFERANGTTAIVDFGWIAEGLIVARTGSIQSLELVLGCFDGREPKSSQLSARRTTFRALSASDHATTASTCVP